MTASGSVGIAFALVCASGLCTTLGATCAFFAKLAQPRVLAAGLGISAGVMLCAPLCNLMQVTTPLHPMLPRTSRRTYVSLVEIFMIKGVEALVEEWGDDAGYRNATLFFFAGMALTAILDQVVHFFSSFARKRDEKIAVVKRDPTADLTISHQTNAIAAGNSEGAVIDIEAQEQFRGDQEHAACDLPRPGPKAVMNAEQVDAWDDETSSVKSVHLKNVPAEIPDEAAAVIDTYVTNDEHRFALKKMGLMTALAIAVHNLPEGLATFVAALADPVNGVAIAVAIALHNIPEGVCVAMPVYYATGSRWKGFWWAFLSGLSEPLGGLLGWLVLYGNRMTDLAYGLLFTIVGGMMTYISIKELIPTALKYDPHDRVTSTAIIAGMVVMAASLLMFTI